MEPVIKIRKAYRRNGTQFYKATLINERGTISDEVVTTKIHTFAFIDKYPQIRVESK